MEISSSLLRQGYSFIILSSDRTAELRKERGLTLRDLRNLIEEQTGTRLSISYLSALERSQAVPEILARLARGYQLSLPDLLAPVDAPVDFAEPLTDN